MDSTIAKVSSAALFELKGELTRLSQTLYGIYETMHLDMSNVNGFWQDGKYQEFVQHYQPKIQKCDEIANRYAEWCAKVLDPAIEKVVDAETVDVGDGRGSVGEWNSTAAVGGGMAAAGVAGASGNFFSLGANPELRPTTKVRGSSVPTPSKEDYYDAFKKHDIYAVDENGYVKLDRNRFIDAVNEVTGKKPLVELDEKMKDNKLGLHPRGTNNIFLNKKLTDDEFIETYPHESQHIVQDGHCKIGNYKDPICVNQDHYITPSCDEEEKRKWGEGSKYCREDKFKMYEGQAREVNAREAGTNARKAAEEYLFDFKRKFVKPKAYRIE